MKKQRSILIAAALAAVSLSSACTLIYDSESSDISSDFDDMGINSSQGESDSSEPSVEWDPVYFSEEDKELQKMLSDLLEPADKVYRWIDSTDTAFGNPTYEFRFPDYDKTEKFVYYLFSVSGSSNNSSLRKPNTYSDLKELLLEYFSADKTETLLYSFVVCSAVENADGTYTVKSTDGSPVIDPPFFIEADGKLFQLKSMGNKSIPIDLDTVKVKSKTDDTIEFTYISEEKNTGPVAVSKYLSDITVYLENADNGTLKYEGGGWKLDSWW